MNIDNSIVKNNDSVNPAVRDAILTAHEKYAETFEKLAEGEDMEKPTADKSQQPQ